MRMSRLGAYIALSGLKEAEFAEQLGVRPPTVNRYSNGRRRPRLAVERKLREITFEAIHGSNCADLITEDEAARMMEDIKAREVAAGEAGEARA